ncbi:hypothetical protein Bsp3421_001352 [Burkholderia sp. FERM BP-3421]|uniref:hypothetical protein n=1 Tax=Burkholderia sp. FERM BP-3421 TaxID=1494466 RepID=UPI002361FC5A|nr:hypothetical protein [Burkholderia sp. FERM BP-3421]WDD91431.1 hypothetical protein Bsp3421_001352 [Burkholderia sp. FERM BP-3421]
MNPLFRYVGAIHGRARDVAITRHDTTQARWHDDGYDMHRVETLYTFDDGAVIRRAVEQEQEQEQAPRDLAAPACAECWIDYEVLVHPDGRPIAPPRQRFDNACREIFWLRYHDA